MRPFAIIFFKWSNYKNNSENMSTTARASNETAAFDLIWKAGQSVHLLNEVLLVHWHTKTSKSVINSNSWVLTQ